VLLGKNSYFAMRVLITGGLGFIGGRLAVHLSKRGFEIFLGSRSIQNAPAWLPTANMRKIDWHDQTKLSKLCEKIDVIVHSAGMNSKDCENDPLEAKQFNGLATERLISSAINSKVQSFVYLSTAHVYKSPLIGFIDEHTPPTNNHPYATSHLLGESALLTAISKGEIAGIVLRLSNTYGAPTTLNSSSWLLVVNDLCRQAITTKEMCLNTNGSQERDFIAMSDVTRVIETYLANFSEREFPKIVNIGSGKSWTVYEMALLIQERCEELFGFIPNLSRQISTATLDDERLIFNTAHPAAFKTRIRNETSFEIDSLLKYCYESYQAESH